MTASLAACLHSTRGAKRRGATRPSGDRGNVARAFRPWMGRNARLCYLRSSVTSGSNWVRTDDQVLRHSTRLAYGRTCSWQATGKRIGQTRRMP